MTPASGIIVPPPVNECRNHGVQRRMVLVDNFFEFFKLLFFALSLIHVYVT